MSGVHRGKLLPPAERRRVAVIAGHEGDEPTARALLGDDDAGVRGAAMAALARMGRWTASDLAAGLADSQARVRQRACELAPGLGAPAGPLVVGALADGDATVVEVAAWALGELRPTPPGAVRALAAVAGHADALCREAAVAGLGAIGDPEGLPAILAATTDKPAVRRRAVLALAPFEGTEVEAALRRALTDRDWQVRQAAEDLLGDVQPDA